MKKIKMNYYLCVMGRIRLILVALLLSCTCVCMAGNLLYGPWVHNVDEHGFTVLWVTEKPSLDYVVLAPDDGSAFEARTRDKYYETSRGRRVMGRYHCVRVEGLTPGTSYRYRIVGKVVKDASSPYAISYGPQVLISPKKTTLRVRTLDSSAESCRFSVLNDIHFNDERYTALSEPIDPSKTDFLVLNGDIVSYAQSIDSVAKHSIMPIARTAWAMPIFYARGNHEGRGVDFDKVYSLFPTSTGEFWYSFRQGPAAFIVLDAGEDKPDSSHEYAGTADYDPYRERETEWLRQAVRDEHFVSAPVKICIVHVPTVNYKDSWYSQIWITENWAPILEEAGIDLMISAHHHKWICSDAGKDGKGYPLLVNSNTERMDVIVTPASIDVKTYDTAGTLCHEWHKTK